MPRTEKLINPFNKYYLGVVKTSGKTPIVTSEGLEVKPLTKKYVVVEKRVSSSYYAYKLYLIDLEKRELIDEERFGDMSYWSVPNVFKPFTVAYSELLKRNSLTPDDVKYVTQFSTSVTDEEWEELMHIIYD